MPVRTWITIALIALVWGCSVPNGVYHTVREGQTLFRISRAYGVDERYLARINGIDDPTHLQVGERLFIPGVKKTRAVPSTASSSSAPTGHSSAATESQSPSRATATALSAPASSGTATPVTGPKINFVWPLKGEILSHFGAKGSPYRKGLEIAASPGNPVVSAAAGKVIYSGNGIRGYGNLIILKHDNSFYTVYGFNRKNLVKAGNYVSKGQKIALSGSPPEGGPSCLYFELRSGEQALDPIFYLP